MHRIFEGIFNDALIIPEIFVVMVVEFCRFFHFAKSRRNIVLKCEIFCENGKIMHLSLSLFVFVDDKIKTENAKILTDSEEIQYVLISVPQRSK